MKWIPAWLAEAYARLNAEFGEKRFGFEGAKAVLKKETKMTSKILNNLEDRGFLISTRDELDKRRKAYKLVKMESILSALAEGKGPVTEKATGASGLQAAEGPVYKLKSAGRKYLITGSSAANLYTGYAATPKLEISVFKSDTDYWITLLKDDATQIAVDDMLAEGRGQVVHLFTDLTEERFQNKAEKEGLSVEAAENTVVLLLKKTDPFKFADALSLLILQRGRLDWKKLTKLARRENVMEELGFCLDAINEEAGGQVFSRKLIDEMYRRSSRPRKEFKLREIKKGPFVELLESRVWRFWRLVEKWNLDAVIPNSLVAKVVHDLVHGKKKEKTKKEKKGE